MSDPCLLLFQLLSLRRLCAFTCTTVVAETATTTAVDKLVPFPSRWTHFLRAIPICGITCRPGVLRPGPSRASVVCTISLRTMSVWISCASTSPRQPLSSTATQCDSCVICYRIGAGTSSTKRRSHIALVGVASSGWQHPVRCTTIAATRYRPEGTSSTPHVCGVCVARSVPRRDHSAVASGLRRSWAFPMPSSESGSTSTTTDRCSQYPR